MHICTSNSPSKLVLILAITFAIVLFAMVPEVHAQEGLPPSDARSTTGPTPEPGVSRGEALTTEATPVLLNVPAFLWKDGCGPTAAGMLIAYWDGRGYDNLIPGDASTQTTAVDARISSTGSYNDYSLPLDYSSVDASPKPDKSELPVGDEHSNDSLADFMKTSQSARGNYYGWSWYPDMATSLQQYVQNMAPGYTAVVQNQTWGTFTWESYRAEIDAGRPVILLVDTDTDGTTDHFVPAIGYDDSSGTNMYAVRDTWDTGVHWYTFAQMSAGQSWGIYGATLFRLMPLQSTPLSPSGPITTFTPTYSWSASSAAAQYLLQVNGPTGNVIKTWYTAAQAGCSSGTGTCSVTPATSLGGGAHTWWVRTWNSAGMGPWSAGMPFNTPVPTRPGAPTLVSPSGFTSDSTPTYTWNEVTGAAQYYLWVNGPSGNVIKKWYTAVQAGCSGGTCSVTLTTELRGGNHTWWVQAWNVVGTGSWSAGMPFSTPTAWPGQPTLISPSTSTTDLTPTYTWNAVTSDTGSPATWYQLSVNGPSGNVVKKWYTAAEAGCSSGTGTCSATPPTTLIPGGTFTWWVRGQNSAGNGLWSAGTSFTFASTGGFDSQFNGSASGWSAYSGSWSIANNAWYGAYGSPWYYVTSGYAGGNYRNFDVRTRVNTNTPHEAYLLVRGAPFPMDGVYDWNSAYYFGFDGYGFFKVAKMVNGTWINLQLWTYTPYLNQGTWNTLRVVASGNNLYYYINGKLAWSGVDSSLTSGQVGFELGTDPSRSLWVDWLTTNSYAEALPLITDIVSPEQQALNDAANAGDSDKFDDGDHQR